MIRSPHISKCDNLSQAFVQFGQLARTQGLNAGIQETLDALIAGREGMLGDMDQLKYALKAIYCCSEEDTILFEKLFKSFWAQRGSRVNGKTTYQNQSNIQKKSPGSLVMLGKGKSEAGEEETKNVSGANQVERLRKTDFSKLSDIDSQYLEQIADRLWRQMSLRLKRKLKASPNNGKLDLRRTLRSSISHGGEPFDLRKKKRKTRKQRLIVLLDVSGSMDKYSFFLLRFLCALHVHFEKIEAFVFSTRLLRITEYLHGRNLDHTLVALSAYANNWSSGTQIGKCFKAFNDDYAKRVLNGHSTVIILSDGLDTGKPEVLAAELKKIKLRTRQLIWLNPLKGMRGYEPVQRGMQAALPEIDTFRSAHSLNSILELENLLLNV